MRKAEFIAKLGIVLEETDETEYWLEILVESEIVKSELMAPLIEECRELMAIFIASLNTAKGSDLRPRELTGVSICNLKFEI